MSDLVIKAAKRLVNAISRKGSPVLGAIYADRRTEEALSALESALGGIEAADDDHVTGGQAARMLGVSRVTISNWKRAGLITPVGSGRQGGGYLYRVGDLRRAHSKPF